MNPALAHPTHEQQIVWAYPEIYLAKSTVVMPNQRKYPTFLIGNQAHQIG